MLAFDKNVLMSSFNESLRSSDSCEKESKRGFSRLYITEQRFLKLWHGWQYHVAFRGRDDYRLLFVYLLASASPCDSRGHLRRCAHNLTAGQLVTTTVELSQGTGISYKIVRTALQVLEDEGVISRKTFHGFGHLITVTNYVKYQKKNTVIKQAMYYDKHKSLVLRAKDEIAEAVKKESEDVGQSSGNRKNSLLNYVKDIKDTKETKDIKEVSKYNIRTNFFKKKRLGSQNYPKPAINSEPTATEKQFELVRGLFMKKAGVSESDPSMRIKQSTKIKFMESLNIVSPSEEEVDELMQEFIDGATSSSTKALAYFCTAFKDRLTALRERKSEEARKRNDEAEKPEVALVETFIEVEKFSQGEDVEASNLRFKGAIKRDVGETTYKAFFEDKVFIIGLTDDLRPIVLFSTPKIKNIAVLHFARHLENALYEQYGRRARHCQHMIAGDECGGIALRYTK